MNRYKIEQLEKYGKIKIKKVPNFNHKRSQEDYNKIIEETERELRQVQTMLNQKLNRVQNEILKICVNKILEVFRYYFDAFTWKENKQKNRLFKRYIRELKNFKKKYFGTGKNDRDLIDELMEKLIHRFLKQKREIIQLEEKLKSSKIAPFEDTIEIRDNKIRKLVD
ncbi:MAG: hypothetical protein EU530_08815 [Promethearchaeota archaeon]|nr:MAG: hypothetical protein EU530_08815 [Candidatus Lokiarchaeota archaeon]